MASIYTDFHQSSIPLSTTSRNYVILRNHLRKNVTSAMANGTIDDYDDDDDETIVDGNHIDDNDQ